MTTVLLQTNISSVKELVLPTSGQILLPSDMVLSFADQNVASPDCDGGGNDYRLFVGVGGVTLDGSTSGRFHLGMV